MSDERVVAYADGRGAFALADLTRRPHEEPCPDCGRTYLNGENITVVVPVGQGSDTRVVWSGCADCWVLRTDPSRSQTPQEK